MERFDGPNNPSAKRKRVDDSNESFRSQSTTQTSHHGAQTTLFGDQPYQAVNFAFEASQSDADFHQSCLNDGLPAQSVPYHAVGFDQSATFPLQLWCQANSVSLDPQQDQAIALSYAFGQATTGSMLLPNALLPFQPPVPSPDDRLAMNGVQMWSQLPWPHLSQQAFPQMLDEVGNLLPLNSTADLPMDDVGLAPKTLLDAVEKHQQLVCFGTVGNIRARLESKNLREIPWPLSAQLQSSDQFHVTQLPRVVGRIQSEYGQMIQGMLDEPSLVLHATCHADGDSSAKQQSRLFMQTSCVLEITVYGPADLLEEIGDWFQEYDIYLQDPRECHRDGKYCNPQRLSSSDPDSCPFVSEVVSRTGGFLNLQDVTQRPDLLDVLSSQLDLEEAQQPSAISTPLQSHQKQALTFMFRREQGWSFDDKVPDMWEAASNDRGVVFINRISDAHQLDEPPPFYGGIIADPMGLGKTLTMIALAASDLDGREDGQTEMDVDDVEKPYSPATLIIIPPPLIGSWEDELEKHVDGSLKCLRHHGKTRIADMEELAGVNVVLTTYHTVSSEWKAGGDPASSILFLVRWRRIILDEAHFIRNGKSRMAKSICSLDSVSRWAVTGTPIQNRLADLSTLLRFIRAHPYTDTRQFENDVSHLWKAGEDEEAVKRLKRLSACLVLRRSKNTIKLPLRWDKQCQVEFTRAERGIYDRIRAQTISKIEEALHSDSEVSRSGSYANILQQIESMRLFCNMGLHYETRHRAIHNGPDPSSSSSAPEANWATLAQRTFNAQRDMGAIPCLRCGSVLDLTETLLGGGGHQPSQHQHGPQFTRCLRFVCGDCAHRASVACGHSPSCPAAPVSLSSSSLEEVEEEAALLAEGSDGTGALGLSSKIDALVADLKTLPSDVKCVVFSSWRLSLDLVKAGLDKAELPSIRFDGKVPQKERQSVVQKFRKDPSIRVMLLTLSCGAVGLTLTEATRAYLLEPHWNPTLEEQALARIHRIGQTKEVTTVRFVMRDSFEERVVEVQQSKKELAGVLLSQHDGGQGDDSLGRLHKLRALL